MTFKEQLKDYLEGIGRKGGSAKSAKKAAAARANAKKPRPSRKKSQLNSPDNQQVAKK